MNTVSVWSLNKEKKKHYKISFDRFCRSSEKMLRFQNENKQVNQLK